MKRLVNFLLLTAVLGLIAVGCSHQSNPIGSKDYSLPTAQKITLPEGAVFESAMLNIYIEEFSNQTVRVHRITAPWNEYTVTWNNFGGAFDPTVEATFNDDAMGWKTVDLSTMFQNWFNGTWDNYGFLFEQDEYAHFTSKEAPEHMPYITICYTYMGELVCVDDLPLGDTYIFEPLPDDNFGHSTVLKVGLASYSTAIEKQTLIQFDLEEVPTYDGCSLTIGYWKTHAGFGPQADVVTQFLPIWLGTADGDKSLLVSNATIAHDVLVMKTYGVPKNGITKLYAQLLGTKLNMANGADVSAVADEMAEADAFLAMYDWTDWDSFSKSEQKDILNLQGAFDDYNNGYIGPGHCGDFIDYDD